MLMRFAAVSGMIMFVPDATIRSKSRFLRPLLWGENQSLRSTKPA